MPTRTITVTIGDSDYAVALRPGIHTMIPRRLYNAGIPIIDGTLVAGTLTRIDGDARYSGSRYVWRGPDLRPVKAARSPHGKDV